MSFKKSELNLMVINNFIDYFTSDDAERNRMKEVAEDYIEEGDTDDNKMFCLPDLKTAFEAGEARKKNEWLEFEAGQEMVEPDFEDWVNGEHGIKIKLSDFD